jgi:anti-sigma factor ChrR (cupin superfamily)
MLNVDFSRQVVIDTDGMEWGGHATSIVQYLKGASFKQHSHPFGEEILVLEGTFSDENGNYPKATYIRNPPGSFHAPYSESGCVLFVKLHQFSPNDTRQFHVDTENTRWLPGIGGLKVMPLHEYENEHVALVKWPAGEKFQPHRHFGGEEILVLSGTFHDEHGQYPTNTWIRSPHMSAHCPFVHEETIIWVKTGHLPLE